MTRFFARLPEYKTENRTTSCIYNNRIQIVFNFIYLF